MSQLNVFNSGVTLFPAPTSDIWGKWNSALVDNHHCIYVPTEMLFLPSMTNSTLLCTTVNAVKQTGMMMLALLSGNVKMSQLFFTFCFRLFQTYTLLQTPMLSQSVPITTFLMTSHRLWKMPSPRRRHDSVITWSDPVTILTISWRADSLCS